jgi:hypothetical protein
MTYKVDMLLKHRKYIIEKNLDNSNGISKGKRRHIDLEWLTIDLEKRQHTH